MGWADAQHGAATTEDQSKSGVAPVGVLHVTAHDGPLGAGMGPRKTLSEAVAPSFIRDCHTGEVESGLVTSTSEGCADKAKALLGYSYQREKVTNT